MKKNVYLVGLILWMLACFWSCSDDKDDGICPDRTVRLYGRSYSLQSGVIWQSNPNTVISSVPYVYEDIYGNGEGTVTDRVEGFRAGDDRTETGNFMLSLYEEGLYYNEGLEKAQGEAACVCFHLASSETGRLVPGKYVFGTEKLPGTFMGYCSSDYNTLERENIPAALDSGEVGIEQNGREWHVTFSCKTTFGGEVTGEYRGELDACRVSQVSSTEYKDISLAGLLEEVEVTTWYNETFLRMIYDEAYADFGGVEGCMEMLGATSFDEFAVMMGLEADNGRYFDVMNAERDYDLEYNGTSLFSLTTGVGQVIEDARKNVESIDMALLWDRAEEAFCFESPIRVRRWAGHEDKYNFPCHTVYMKAPDNFSDADFENLSAETFSYAITEETVKIPTRDFQPCYVFFQTGKGVQGVIKVISWIPEGVQIHTEESMGDMMGYRIPRNPALQVEIKCPAVVANPQIR